MNCRSNILFVAIAAMLACAGHLRAESHPIRRFVFLGHILHHVRNDSLLELADAIVAEHPDAVVVGGDVVPGIDRLSHVTKTTLEEQWAKFDVFVNRLGVPVYLVPGNHDVASSDPKHRAYVRSRFPEKWKNPAIPPERGAEFIFVSSVDPVTGAAFVSDDDLRRVSRRLAGAGDKSVLLFVHHRLWERDDWDARIRPVLSTHESTYVFAGDGEDVRRLDDTGLSLFACGNGSNTLNFLVVRVDESGHVDVKAHSAQPVPLVIDALQKPPLLLRAKNYLRYRMKETIAIAFVLGGLAGVCLSHLWAKSRVRSAPRRAGWTNQNALPDAPITTQRG